MAAELTYNEKTGVANVFVVRLPAWHREGTVFETAPDLETAMKAAGQDFEVDKIQLYAEIPGVGRTETEGYATFRKDTGAVLGVVGNRYSVLQNARAFEAYRPMVESGLITLETGGTLRGGTDVWLLGKFDLERVNGHAAEVFGREGILPYCLISNNHAGKRKAVVQETKIRVVCANTLGAATSKHVIKGLEAAGKALSVSHRGEVGEKIDAGTEKLWGHLVRQFRLDAFQYDLLRLRKLTDKQLFDLVLDVAAPLPKRTDKELSKRQETSMAKTMARRDRIVDLWANGDGHVGDRSAFEAYNGFVQSVDHDTEIWNTRGEGSRLASLWDGHLSQVKTQVLNSLLEDAITASEGSLVERIINRQGARTAVTVDSILGAMGN